MAGAEKAGTANSRCSQCGAEFRCGISAGETTCWCMQLPVLSTAGTDATACYCPECLKSKLPAAAAT